MAIEPSEGSSRSHVDEMSCLLYLEGQLEDWRAAELERHTEACSECRSLLRALEGESRLLFRSLREEEESVPARLLDLTRRRIHTWAWTLAFGLLTGLLYAFWNGIVVPWQQQMSQAGFGGSDLLTALIFGGAFWKGWTSMGNLLQVGAVIGFAIALAAVLRRFFRNRIVMALVVSLLLAALAAAPGASAAEVKKGPSYTLPAGQVLNNDLVLATTTAHIDGTVEGDVIVFCESLTVSGHVTGDVIAFSHSIRIDGTVDGNVRTFSGSTWLAGSVGHNVSSFSQTLDLDSHGQVNGSVMAFSAQTSLEGRIGRDLMLFVSAGELNGPVGGGMRMFADRFTFGPGTDVKGPANYKGRHEPDVAAGAKFASPLQWTIVKRQPEFFSAHIILHAVLRFVAALLVGVLLLVLMPGFFADGMDAVRRPVSIGYGAIALLVGCALVVLSVMLITVGVGMGLLITGVYFPILGLAQIFVGMWIGEKILGRTTEQGEMMVRLLLGLFLIRIVGLIPFLGALSWTVVFMWGVGAILVAMVQRRNLRVAPAAA